MPTYQYDSTEPGTADLIEEKLVDVSNSENNHVRVFISEHNFKFQISDIKKVNNYFLEALYELKKAEIKSRFAKPPTEHVLIHVTSASNVHNIVRENYDWRRITRGKFGLGTSFSDDAFYANRYANYNIGTYRALIITKVLVSRTTKGFYNQTHLTQGFDTSVGNNNKVYVKFHDNEMLPLFVIYYTCSTASVRTHNVNQMACSIPYDPSGGQRLLSCLPDDKQSMQNIHNLINHHFVSSHCYSARRKLKSSTSNQQYMRNINNVVSSQVLHPQSDQTPRPLPSSPPPVFVVGQRDIIVARPNQYPDPSSVNIQQQDEENDSSSKTKWVIIAIIVIIIFAALASQKTY